MGNNSTTIKNYSLGIIPEDWKEMRFDSLAKIVRGGSPRPAGDPKYFNGSFIPWLTVASLTNISASQTEVFETEGFLTEEGSKLSRTLEKGTLILSNSGATLGVAKLLGIKCCANDGIAAFIDWNDNIADRFYAMYFLNGKTNYFREVVAPGNGQPNLNTELIGIEKILLPTLPEQRAIATCLSTMDATITKINQLIVQKEQQKKWLMQNLLTGMKRLKGFGGDWKKERLEKYLVKHDEKSVSNNQYPVLTSSRRGIFLQSEYYTRDIASEDNTGYNVVPRGFFTYRHMSDDLIFKFNINDIVDRGIVSTLYPVFTTKNINSFFLLCKLNEGNEFKIHAQEQKQGGSRTYVYFKTLCQLKINLPSVEEQTAIALVLHAADNEIQLLKTKTEKLKEQKKGMMQVLLTGKKRLKIN